jgi:hypothetical protein
VTHRLRVTVRGPLAVLAIAVLGLSVRHLLVDSLTPAEAESIIRASRGREVSAHYDPLLKSSDGTYDRVATQAFADAMQAVTRERYLDVRVKRTWIPPVMVRQPAYYVSLTRESSAGPEYYRVRGVFARRVSRFLWLFPVL